MRGEGRILARIELRLTSTSVEKISTAATKASGRMEDLHFRGDGFELERLFGKWVGRPPRLVEKVIGASSTLNPPVDLHDVEK